MEIENSQYQYVVTNTTDIEFNEKLIDDCDHNSILHNIYNDQLGQRIPDIENVRRNIETHLTKEELLDFSLFRQTKPTQNQGSSQGKRRHSNEIHKVFLYNNFGKAVSSGAITKKRKRLLKVLACVGELLRFKRQYNMDQTLKDILTKKQYIVLMMYERRILLKDIVERLKLAKWKEGRPTNRTVTVRFYSALDKLKKSNNPNIAKYLVLLKAVLKFSRKYPKSKH